MVNSANLFSKNKVSLKCAIHVNSLIKAQYFCLKAIRIQSVLLRESTMISPEFKTQFTPGVGINGIDVYVCNLILQAMCQPELKY
jgi:hypothetical protein